MRGALGAVGIGLAAILAAGQAVAAGPSGEGEWTLKAPEGAPAGGPACVLAPKAPSRIQVTRDRLDVTGLPRQSIFNYQYRIDENPVSTAAIPSAAMQEAGVVSLQGDALREVLDGHRLRIRILDRWHEAITEDVGLTGLRDLYRRLEADCR